uniref:Uncharacterized protein n=1 Tax=Oryza glumipatula TaxID=40148 RepID=A0A0D9ZVG2_9ORYZ
MAMRMQRRILHTWQRIRAFTVQHSSQPSLTTFNTKDFTDTKSNQRIMSHLPLGKKLRNPLAGLQPKICKTPRPNKATANASHYNAINGRIDV